MAKVIGIIGSRRRNTPADYTLTVKAFQSIYVKGDILVSGGCPQGGDHFAELISIADNVPIKIHRAEWGLHGRSAGFKRNGLIARDADILIAVVHVTRTGGTEDTIAKFKRFHPTGKVILV